MNLFLSNLKKNSYRPSIKLECVKEILAYDSIQKCKEDLLAYKLAVVSVPLTETNHSINPLSKNTSSKTNCLYKKKLDSKPSFSEDVLDCKSCSVQF